jgi:hypothetical protein
MIGMIMTGRMKAILRMPLGKVLIAFTCWVMICVPFSVWRGGSLTIFLITLQALVLVAFMAAFIRTIPDCLRVMYTVALVIVVIAISATLKATVANKARQARLQASENPR